MAEYDYSTPGWYFVTTCARMWEIRFGQVIAAEMTLNDAGLAVARKWMELPSIFSNVDLDEFVVMPNHFHGIIIIKGDADGGSRAAATPRNPSSHVNLSRIMNAFKTTSARRVNQICSTQGLQVWQDGFYDHVIRNDRDLFRIRTYIRNNPLKWLLDRENPQSQAFHKRLQLASEIRPRSSVMDRAAVS